MSKTRPSVSVIIPTYNRAETVCNAVRSVLTQTYRDTEVIVVDDGSTDDTVIRLNEFLGQIRTVSANHHGASAARNKGIHVAKGEFLAFLDSDDAWLPTKLEHQITLLTELGPNFGMCFTDCQYVGDPELKCSPFEEGGLTPNAAFGSLESPLEYVLARYTVIYLQSVVVRSALARELNGFDELMIVCEDTDFLFRVSLKTRCCFVSGKLVEIRPHKWRSRLTDLFSKKSKSDFMYASRRRMYEKWLGFSILSPDIRAMVQYQLRELLYEWTIAHLYRLRLQSAIRRIKDIESAGDSYGMVGATLLRRAVARVHRNLLSLTQ